MKRLIILLFASLVTVGLLIACSEPFGTAVYTYGWQ